MIVDTVQSVQEGVLEIVTQQKEQIASFGKGELSRVTELRTRLADALKLETTSVDVSIELLGQDIAKYKTLATVRATSTNNSSIESVETLRIEILDLLV